MKTAKLFVALVITALLLSLAGPVVAAPPADNPGKGPPDFDKVVFVHYPKGEAPGKPPGTPGRGPEEGDYVYDGYHWADTSLPVYYVVNLTGSGGDTTFLGGIQEAFQTWEVGPNSDMDFECDGVDSTAVISSLDDYRDGYNVVGWANISADYPEAIAVTIFWYNVLTKEVVEVDVAMNSDPYFVWWQNSSDDEVWDFADTPDKFDVDVQNIMTHEAGHWLVLGDLYADANSEKTMYGYAAELELKKRSLDPGDEAGIQAIYPTTEEADTVGPLTSNVATSPNPTNGASSVTLTADIDDSTTGNSNIVVAEWFTGEDPGEGYGTAMVASDGTFNEVTEAVTADIDVSGWALGDYTLYVRGLDAEGNWGLADSVVLYVTAEAPTEGAMHVADIEMSFGTKTAGRNTFYWAIATVTVIDADGMPVQGATVEGHWEVATTDSDSGTTDTNGRVSLQSDSVRNPPAGTIFTFVVDSVTKDGWTYDSEANEETSDSISVL